MKVLFDHQLFSWQRYGGASKYFAMLLSHLPKDVWETTTIFSNNAYVEALDLFPRRHFLYNHFFRGQGRIMHELNKPYTCCRLISRDFDIYHQTHFEPFGLKWIGNKPMVTTFHDTNFSTLNPNQTVVKWQKKSLERANKIIAISENTRRDVIELFNLNPDKVTVIYHGIEPVKQYDSPRLIENPYILYVGTRENHKNFRRFIEAYAKIALKYTDLKLVCTWKAFSEKEIEKFSKLNILNRVIHFSASEDEMNILYRDALFFCFPSLYEGFGMPILEAMANCCPVVLSNASCFPEIAADAGLYFNPNDVDDIVDKMEQIINNPSLRKTLIEKGGLRVKDFSWDKCAQQHLEVYKSLL
jgi:Glycosyltransferase